MTQIEHATFEEIARELSKRYLASVIIIKHTREGGQPPAVRIEQSSKDRCLSDVIGLLRTGAIALDAMQLRELRTVLPNEGLDQ